MVRGLLANLANEKHRSSTSVIACVVHSESAAQLRTEFSQYGTIFSVLEQDNVRGAQQANAVILACPKAEASPILSEPGMRNALEGKLVLSLVAGTSVSKLSVDLYGTPSAKQCTIVRAMPNIASSIGESVTIIEKADPALSPADAEFVRWLFSAIGRVVFVPARLMGAGTALGAAGPAFCALVLEAMVEGGVHLGLERDEARVMAAQAMRGASGLVLGGDTPAVVRERVSTPGGCTVAGLQVLEEAAVRSTMVRALARTADMADAMAHEGKSGSS